MESPAGIVMTQLHILSICPLQAIGKKLIIERRIKKKPMESVMNLYKHKNYEDDENNMHPDGGGKSRINRSIIYICAFTVPFLMAQIFFAICRVYPYGPFSILTGDMDLEFVNFYSYYLKTFSSKSDHYYMLAKTLGGEYPGLAAFQLHDPLLFILFLFPGERIAVGIEQYFALQISVAGLSASILLNGRYRKSWMSLLFSTAYSFCGFFFGYLVLTIYFGSLAILPLVIYFFLKALDDKKYEIPYIVVTALYIYINYHMGFMLVIFMVLLFISRIIENGAVLKKLPMFVLSGATILMIDGYFLIRTGLSLLGAKTTEGADYGIYRRFVYNQLFAGLFSGTSWSERMPLIYCSVASVFFALIYFISKEYGIREKLANLFLIAAVSVSMWINLLDTVWHGFNNPEGFYWRYAYYISLILIVLGYKGFVSIVYGDGAGKKSVIKIPAAAFIICMYMVWLMISGNPYMDTQSRLINALIIAGTAAGTFMIITGGRIRIYGMIVLILVSGADMLYNAKTSFIRFNSDNGELPLISRFEEDYTSIKDVIDAVKAGDAGMYRIEKDFDRAVNDPAMFDYIGMSHDSSCEKDAVIDWLMNFGFCRTVYYTYYNGGSTSFVDMLFGIKYYVSRFDGIQKPYQKMPYEGKYFLYENRYALPMAFAAPDGFGNYTFDKDKNTFEKQNEIAALWGGKKDIYLKADAEQELMNVMEDDEGHYVRTGEEARIDYNITVTENMPLYFYFSAPERQPAELYINDEFADLYFTEKHWGVICAGTYNVGDNVKVSLKLPGEDIRISEASFFYEDEEAIREWSKLAASLNEGVGELNEITSSHMVFNTDFDKDSLVVLSIPYDRNFRVSVDGKRVEPTEALEMLMGVDIPAGKHVVELKYIPAGTVTGVIVSAAGIVMFIIFFCIRFRRDKDVS